MYFNFQLIFLIFMLYNYLEKKVYYRTCKEINVLISAIIEHNYL